MFMHFISINNLLRRKISKNYEFSCILKKILYLNSHENMFICYIACMANVLPQEVEKCNKCKMA